MVQGDDINISVTVNIDLSGYTLDAHINTDPVTPITIVPVDLTLGQFTLVIPKEVTSVIPYNTTWALEWDDVAGNHLTVVAGRIKLKENV